MHKLLVALVALMLSAGAIAAPEKTVAPPTQPPATVYPLPPTSLDAPQPLNPLKEFRKFLGRNTANQEPVDPEQAFRVHLRTPNKDGLTVAFDIADCCYLYRDRMKFVLTPTDGAALEGARLGNYKLPRGKVKHDEFVGATEVYYDGVDVRLPFVGLGGVNSSMTLDIMYQGCAEKGVAICYAPTTKRFPLSVANGALAVGAIEDAAPITVVPDAPPASTNATRGFLWPILAAFGVGLLLTFTPCVLPLIPILSSMIVGNGERNITKLEGGLMSATYVLGTAVTYAVAGAVAGATGEQLQAYFQNPWMIAAFAFLFMLLAASMFGFYELQMPAFIQSHLHWHSTRVHHRTRHVSGAAFAGIFVVGLLSALIIGACVSPLVISVLGVAIASRDPWLGGATMFAMALGMGVVLIAIGVGAGFLLPRAGPWMHRVKQVFGVLLLAVAIYLLGFIPEVPVVLLWAVLFIVVAIYLGATQGLPKGASGWRYLWKGLGTVLLVWGILALLGGFAGNRDILRPLPPALTQWGMTPTGEPAIGLALLQPVRSLREIEGFLAEAKTAGKPALLDYYADWCLDCTRMDQSTLRDARVRERLATRFVALQADVTDPNDPEVRAIKQRFGVYGPPAMLFFDVRGQERRDLRAYGYKSAADLLTVLTQVDRGL